MGRACRKVGVLSKFQQVNLQERDLWGGLGVDSAQDRNYWRALVNAALDLRVPLAMELVSASNCKLSFSIFESLPNLVFHLSDSVVLNIADIRCYSFFKYACINCFIYVLIMCKIGATCNSFLISSFFM